MRYRYDETDSGEVWFEDDVRKLGPSLKPRIDRALIAILKNPEAGELVVLGGKVVVYGHRINAALDGSDVIQSVMVTYRIDKGARLIRKLTVIRLADLAPKGERHSTDEELEKALMRAIEKALIRARQKLH